MKHAVAILAVATGCKQLFGLEDPTLAPAQDDAAVSGPWDQIAVGGASTCAIQIDGTLWCFGHNELGQLGIASAQPIIDEPTQVPGTWASVVLATSHTCGIQTDQTLWCWGQNAAGKLGIDTSDTIRTAPSRLPGTWRRVTLGLHHTCAIDGDGALWCWGSNGFGQLGDGTAVDRSRPALVASGSRWLDVIAGFGHTCGIRDDATLWCWGNNQVGQHGDANLTSHFMPRRIGEERWVELASMFGTTCGRTLSNAAHCWGLNQFGEVGRGSVTNMELPGPVLVDGTYVTDWTAISAGANSACGLRADGTAACWGLNWMGQLTGDSDIHSSPATLPGNWRAIETGYHTCAIDQDRQLWCVGNAAAGQLGDGATSRHTPVQIATNVTRIDSGHFATCAIAAGGSMLCTGYGSLGDGTARSHRSLTSISDGAQYSAVAVGQDYRCAAATDGIRCWGENYYHQLGDATTTTSRVPKLIRSGAHAMIAASAHTCALAGSALYCWGRNDQGQAGVGTTTEVTAPAEITSGGGGNGWTEVSVGALHTCARHDNGLRCWGANAAGQLGTGSTTGATSPQSVAANVTSIAAGGHHTCGIQTDLRIACWGLNSDGQLGLGDFVQRTVPSPVAGAWQSVAAGLSHTCGIKLDGSLWCWGRNRSGQLGIGSYDSVNVPARVGTDSNWSAVSAGHTHTCALKANSSVWCWGDNTWGALGDGTGWRTELGQVP